MVYKYCFYSLFGRSGYGFCIVYQISRLRYQERKRKLENDKKISITPIPLRSNDRLQCQCQPVLVSTWLRLLIWRHSAMPPYYV
jgi:hypothetical protein